MTKIDYKTLETEDLLSLARKICEAASENVDSAYDKISAEVNRILEKEKDSDKTTDILDVFLTGDQLNKELQRRRDDGWKLIRKKAEDENQTEAGTSPNRYLIELEFDDDGFVCGGDQFILPGDNKKGIPNEQLLKDRPFEWLAKYLKSYVYKEDEPGEVELSDEEYDEGFDE